MKLTERQLANTANMLFQAWNTLGLAIGLLPKGDQEGAALIRKAKSAAEEAMRHYDKLADDATEWNDKKGGMR